MKISFFQRKKHFDLFYEMPWTPLLILLLFFSNNVFTVPKSILLVFIILTISKRNLLKYFDLPFILICMFFVIYALMSELDSGIKTEFTPALLFMPAVLYTFGKWLADKSKNTNALVLSFLFIGVSLSGLAILGIWDNFAQYGFESGSRNIVVGQAESEINATVLGGTLIVLTSLGGLIFTHKQHISWIVRCFIILSFLLSMFLALRLGSRTLLGLGGIILIFGLARNINRKTFLPSFLMAIVFFACIYLITDILDESMNLDFYFRDRIGSDAVGTNNLGGRLELWLGALSLIPTNPYGWSIFEIGYSHNLWLDIARNGGWFSLVVSIFLSTLFIFNIKKALYKNRNDFLYSSFIWCLTIGFIGLFMVEPILDGFIYPFGVFCLFWGTINAKVQTN